MCSNMTFIHRWGYNLHETDHNKLIARDERNTQLHIRRGGIGGTISREYYTPLKFKTICLSF